uniref:FAM234A/B beta-propeller domain-containing protein n=1 Tax=Biomphalaria glabrata TaxID=6526 RepID=A0A2C9JEN2_BIOGL
MASARVFFSKKRKNRNGFINEEIPVVENGYDVQESDEDEVFVQDPHLEISASKPLMHPRTKSQRTKVKTRTSECQFCSLFKPIFYFVALVSVLCGVMATIVYIANKHTSITNSVLVKQGESLPGDTVKSERAILIGCDKLEVSDVWVVGIPKLLTESAFRLVDVNQDGVLDVVLGFATGADGYGVKEIVCDIYFDGNKPCYGGLIALDGATGKELWRRYTLHEIYGLNCQYDLNKDGVKDCLSAGRAGTFLAISCKDGAVLWELGKAEAINPVMNFYTPQYINDITGDDIPDIILVHGGDPLQEAGSAHRLSGRLMLVSGKTGEVVMWTGVPDNRESYYSPQIISHLDGVQFLIFGTGGETHNGSLWRLEVESLKQGLRDRSVKLSSDTHKGFMTPPALVDITHDGIEDIIVPMFNSTILALDGKTYRPIWSLRFPMSETYSTPAVGYYNEDDVPDFLVKFAHGPGYPLYYYSETTVIDGKTGKRLIDPSLRDTIGSQSSPLTVAMEGLGNDAFIVWMADCAGHEGATEEFSFVKGTKDHEKSRSNLCRLRFKSNGFSKLVAISRTLPKGGTPIYNSEQRKTVEHSKWVNTSVEAYEYIIKHPEIFSTASEASTQWNDADNGGYQFAESLYNQPDYVSTHRTSSKKGPGITSPIVNRKKASKQNYNSRTQYVPKGSNNDNYNPSSSFNLHPNMADDEYSLPYRDTDTFGNRGYYNPPYGAYYPADDKAAHYNQRYPHAYRSVNKRTTTGSYPKNMMKLKRSIQLINKRRTRRHVGPHDDEGLQRLLSTGTLAPTTLAQSHSDYNSTIDIIFATYWFFPSKTQAILPQDQKCIADKLAKEGEIRLDPESSYYQMNHDEYEEAATMECLKLSDHQVSEEGVYTHSDDEYNPLDLNMGQMTIYRLRLKFSCSQRDNSTESKYKCATVLPYTQQRWAGYMGSNGDSHWLPPMH